MMVTRQGCGTSHLVTQRWRPLFAQANSIGVPCVDACLVSRLTGKVVVDGQEAIQTQLKGDGIIYQQVQIEPNTLLYSKNNGLHRYFCKQK
jgi:hypothetical protein